MDLSIIVVSCNEAEYISVCLYCILNQNVTFNYGIIICDVGSSDNSLEIKKEYNSKHKNITHFVQNREPKYHKFLVMNCLKKLTNWRDK